MPKKDFYFSIFANKEPYKYSDADYLWSHKISSVLAEKYDYLLIKLILGLFFLFTWLLRPLDHDVFEQTMAIRRKKKFTQETRLIKSNIQAVLKEVPHANNKLKLYTFNQVFSFVVLNNLIWYAKRIPNKRPQWELFYFDKINAHNKILQISTDGPNLDVLLENGVHYKKTFLEYRSNDTYFVENISHYPEAIPTWFSLPILSCIYNLYSGDRLILKNSVTHGISNRGPFKNFYSDARGARFYGFWITGLYSLLENRTLINIHDPYIPLRSKVRLQTPQKHNKKFIAFDMSESASMVAVFGKSFKYKANSLLTEKNKLYTILYCADSRGYNPILWYTYDKKKLQWRLLPMPGWQSHKLPDIKVANFRDLTLLQTGQGNTNFELRLLIKRLSDYYLYYKSIDDANWSVFKASNGYILNKMLEPFVPYKPTEAEKKPIVFNWYQKKAKFYKSGVEVNLYDFNPYCSNSELVVKTRNMTLNFNLLKRKDLIVDTFINSSVYYDLVDSTHSERVRVIEENEDTINIYNSNINFSLKKQVYTSF